MRKLIECVPNFSEGRDMGIVKQITEAIQSVEGISLLNVDPGKATNRTVVTFVGEPEQVVEAAYAGIKKAGELIDMSKHKGEHPRMGATDVCPFVPVANITMEETVEYARKLAKRVGEELNIPVYCYEAAAFKPERRNLATCRSGEYEGLKDKIIKAEWKPDFGKAEFNAKSGATVIGARNFLVAINFNLNTTSVRRANSVAFDVREAGRIKREGNPISGKIVKDENGKAVRIPGDLKSTKAIGWFIKEYGIAQISMNLTDLSVTSVHKAFDTVCKRATERGLRVSGSELVGLIPLNAMTEAGKYFLKKQNVSTGVSEEELVRIAVKSMGLDELADFNPQEKIIEYMLQKDKVYPLINMNLKEFADETASDSPAPGGGSVSALMGTLGISLATMVANLSANKRGWDNRVEEFGAWARKGQELKKELLYMIDEDTNAFNKIMAAFGMPKKSEAEKDLRSQAIEEATKYAIEVPLKVMKLSFATLEIIEAMANKGNPNSVSDAGVGALAVRSAVMGAWLNVKINAASLKDKTFVEKVMKEGEQIVAQTKEIEERILKQVNKIIEA